MVSQAKNGKCVKIKHFERIFFMLCCMSSVDEFRETGEDMAKLKNSYIKIALLGFSYLLSMWMSVFSLNGGRFWTLLSAFIRSFGGILFISCLIHL